MAGRGCSLQFPDPSGAAQTGFRFACQIEAYVMRPVARCDRFVHATRLGILSHDWRPPHEPDPPEEPVRVTTINVPFALVGSQAWQAAKGG